MEQRGRISFAQMGIVARRVRNTLPAIGRAPEAREYAWHGGGVERPDKPDGDIERGTAIAAEDATNGAAVDTGSQRELGMRESPCRDPQCERSAGHSARSLAPGVRS